MSATPKATRRPLPSGGGLAPDEASDKCDQSPLPKAIPKITKPAIAPNLSHVATLTNHEPLRTPKIFSVVSTAMAATAASFCRERSIEAGPICAEYHGRASGKKTAQKYCAKPTASAAMVPVCTTVKIIQP